MTDILLEGRIVGGHPMERRAVTDDHGKPKLDNLGSPRSSLYVGLAIPKNPGVDWKAEPWGQQIVAVALADWPNGEHMQPAFAWKVTDGDSIIPNTKQKRPCDNDGYPGHWVVQASTALSVRCFHAGKFEPHEVIQDKNQIKRGDYGRLFVQVKGNGPSLSPGLYINPDMFALDRAGVAIVGAESNAADVFGGGAPAQTATPLGGAVPPAGQQQPPAAPVALTMTAKANGATYEAFIASGFTDAMMIEQGYALAPGGVQQVPGFLQPPVA